jgi:hypothetical protein
MNLNKYILISFLIYSNIFIYGLNAQTLLPVKTIPVFNNNKELKNPWVGGMNNPEFSSIDLNRDSHKDLFVFDKDGYKVNTYINLGNPDSPHFVYAPQYQKNFPEMTKLVLIRDYNKDGVDDIYTSAIAGLKLLKGTYLGGENYSYAVIDSPVRANFFGTVTNLYNANDDIPGIRDMDNDGDLDILVNSIFGQTYEFYRNLSVDSTGSPDTSVYEYANSCWGHFNEDPIRNNLLLGACKTDGPVRHEEEVGEYRHSGCTIELIDQDGDNDVELLLGDPGFNTIVFGKNGGTLADANITSEDTIFPAYSNSIRLNIFPATFSLDMNNDGANDIIAAPNVETAAENVGNVWYYKNVGPTSNQQFIFQSDSFMVGDMIDVGKNSKPVLFDFNNDNLDDILVANEGYFNKTTLQQESKIALYQNIGTADSPTYKLITKDYQSLYALGLVDMKISMGDIDADGDEDMLIGDNDGKLNMFYNQPTGGVANFTNLSPTIGLAGIDVGLRANPCLYDIDADGDLDIITGRIDGKVSYYWNFGTASVFQFDKDSVNSNFGQINVLNTTSHPDGNSSVFIKNSLIYVGSQYGVIQVYQINIDSLRTGTFVKNTSKFAQIRDGYNSNIYIKDLNQDGLLEYLLGNSRGGVTMYSEADWDTIIAPKDVIYNSIADVEKIKLYIYPNPSNDYITITTDLKNANFVIYNMDGQVLANDVIKSTNTQIDIRNYRAGIYFVKIYTDKKTITSKLVVY